MSESKIQVIRHWNLYKTIINSKNACLQSSNKLGISGGHQHVIHPFPQTSKLSPGTHVLLLADKDTKIHLIFQCKHSHQETWKLVHPKFPNIRAPNHLQAPGKMIQNVLHCTFQLFNYFSSIGLSCGLAKTARLDYTSSLIKTIPPITITKSQQRTWTYRARFHYPMWNQDHLVFWRCFWVVLFDPANSGQLCANGTGLFATQWCNYPECFTHVVTENHWLTHLHAADATKVQAQMVDSADAKQIFSISSKLWHVTPMKIPRLRVQLSFFRSRFISPRTWGTWNFGCDVIWNSTWFNCFDSKRLGFHSFLEHTMSTNLHSTLHCCT